MTEQSETDRCVGILRNLADMVAEGWERGAIPVLLEELGEVRQKILNNVRHDRVERLLPILTEILQPGTLVDTRMLTLDEEFVAESPTNFMAGSPGRISEPPTIAGPATIAVRFTDPDGRGRRYTQIKCFKATPEDLERWFRFATSPERIDRCFGLLEKEHRHRANVAADELQEALDSLSEMIDERRRAAEELGLGCGAAEDPTVV